MAQPELGNIQMVNVRELWKNEERDFTPWLAENIGQLSITLGVRIVIDQIEQRVGGYELDIKGHVEDSETVVIIENQLECTDHTHLGQLITYAASLGASIVIWVTPEVRDEHRTAIEWLNTHIDDKISFFLVRPEVFRIDSSKPAVRFQVEASPDEWGRRLKSIAGNEDPPRYDFRRKFWGGLLSYLAEHGHEWAKGRTPPKYHWISSSIGRSGTDVNVAMVQGSRLRVEIYCLNDSDKQQFDTLYTHKELIEAKFPAEQIVWENSVGKASTRIGIYRAYEKDKAEKDTVYQNELFDWVCKRLMAFRDIAREYLARATEV